MGLIQKNKNESELYHEYFYFIFNKSFKDEKYNEINVARYGYLHRKEGIYNVM